MNILVKLTIEKPVADVWEVMGNQFGEAAIWSSNFHTSKSGGNKKFEGLDYSLRDTTTDRGNTIQELTEFDQNNHSFSYVITQGAPDIAKSAGATWALRENGSNTELEMEFHMEPKMPLNEEMENKIKIGLTAQVNQLGEELKFYMEEGKPHPNNH